MTIKELVKNYVSYHRSLGQQFTGTEHLINGFARYVGEDCDITSISDAQCDDYLASKLKPKSTSYWMELFYAINGMICWAIARGYMSRNPMPKYRINKYEELLPHIFTTNELNAIFKTIFEYQKYTSNVIHPECICAYIKTLLTMGLRPGEGRRLKLSDLHLNDEEMYIIIRETKFYKKRLVTFGKQVQSMLLKFLSWRQSVGMEESPESFLFLDKTGKNITEASIKRAFRKVLKRAGVIKQEDGTKYTYYRLYDLRHTFATKRVEVWYEEGDDPQSMLQYLSTYLGHVRLEDTQRYITMTNIIMQEASSRFKKYANQ